MSQIKNIVEALLLSSGEPLSADKIHKIITSKESCTKADILEAIESLKIDYTEKEIEISRVASGFRIQAKSSINDFLNIIYAEKTPRYSRALMETLSIIAYKQPLTRQEVDDIRGVDSSGVVKTLLEKKVIGPAGRKKVPGRPIMYRTTQKFLEYFGLKDLSDLPTLEDLKEELEGDDPPLQSQIELSLIHI